MLPDGFVLNQIKAYNRKLLYWALLMLMLSVYPLARLLASPESCGDWDYFALSFFVMMVLINLTKFLTRSSRPVLHPMVKSLRAYGDTEELLDVLDREAAESQADPRQSIIVTPSWIIHRGLFTLKAIPLTHVAWFYLKPGGTGSIRRMAVFTMQSKIIRLRFNEAFQKGNDLAAEISGNAPWAYSGYSRKIAALWHDDRQKILRTVEERLKARDKSSAAK